VNLRARNRFNNAESVKKGGRRGEMSSGREAKQKGAGVRIN
jgi:hypothetical protein